MQARSRPQYREGLSSSPAWAKQTRKAKNEAQRDGRLSSLIDYWDAGNDWPRHKNPDTEEERLLGVWLQYQRTKIAAGQLDPGKTGRLDKAMPGRRGGRTNGRRKSVSAADYTGGPSGFNLSEISMSPKGGYILPVTIQTKTMSVYTMPSTSPMIA